MPQRHVVNAGVSPILLALTLALTLLPLGCTRHFFRQRADKQVDAVLAEKDRYPRWRIEAYHVYPDPQARFADPTNPDRPPMPPDDPAAFELGPNPQKPGKAGIDFHEGQGYLDALARWDAENRAALAQEDPNYKPPEPPKPSSCQRWCNPPYRITLEQSVELGQFNSREFQDARENLYLTALPVTLERFAFAPQCLAAGQALRQWAGHEVGLPPNNGWSLASNFGIGQLFSTGALALIDFANTTVVDFTQVPKTISQSTLNLNLVQPLLRGGGLAVTLEPLTQVERNLLYQIRTFARFRKTFYVSVAGGGGGSLTGGSFVPSNVIGNTNVAPGSGINQSTPIVPGVIPSVPLTSVGLQVTPGPSGDLNLNGALPIQVSGYLGTMLEYAQIAIDQENIVALERFLQLFQAIKEGGDVSQLQVNQVEQQLLQGRSALLLDVQQYGNALDQFRLQLGVPTDLPMELDDEAIRPLVKLFRRYEEIIRQYDDVSQAAAKLGAPGTAGQLREQLHKLTTTSPLVLDTQFAKEITARWSVWERLSDNQLRDRILRLGAERRQLLDRQTDLEQQGKPLPQAEQKHLAQIDAELDIADMERSLRIYEAQINRKPPNAATLLRSVINPFLLVVGGARNERLEALRDAWPEVPRLCVEGSDLMAVDEDEAFCIASRYALANRFDLMNVRGQLVDAWRQLTVFANALLGTMNVSYNVSSFTPVGSAAPFAFSGARTRQQLGLQVQPPLVRVSERNSYRAALIGYQRQRRQLMEAEDLVLLAVRGEIRQLRVLAANYRIQQRQVELAYLTVENALDTFQAPPAAGNVQSTAAQAAALTNQLLQAQTRVPQAQNALLTVWINYLNTRFQLYRDLELMPLDARGVWIDDVARCHCPPGDTSGQRTDRHDSEGLPAPRPLGAAETNPPTKTP
jgi:outer membrane protein TolC